MFVPATRLPTALFDYPLPEELIAQQPLKKRDDSRLLLAGDVLQDRRFHELPELLEPGDLLVANHTKVRAARLLGQRANGGAAEILVLERAGDGSYVCLVRPGRRLPTGIRVHIASDFVAVIGGAADGHAGARTVTFECAGDVEAAIERCGTAPLPPYIHEALPDRSRYQTTYAHGAAQSAAAPTAGLHFTDEVRRRLQERDIHWASLDLQVGLGTFAPMTADSVSDHVIHRERYALSEQTADAVNQTRRRGGRVVAVGTTSLRVLETCVTESGDVVAGEGVTDLYVTPGYPFKVVDGLLTNFHQPKSSLVVLVAAFIGVEQWRAAYSHAITQRYRFLSFGDCMLAWGAQ